MQTLRFSARNVILLLTLLVPCSGFCQEHLPAVLDTPIPRSYFGLHVKHETQSFPGSDIDFGNWRLLDNDVVWRNVETSKNQWVLYHLNDLVGIAERHHVSPLLTLGFTPTWASARPDEKIGRGWAAEPKNMQDWHDYVEKLATQYKGRIHDWEIWNEANDKLFYSGSVEQMVKLAQVAYEILKRVDPSNTVISPSLTYGLKGIPWLNDYLRAGGGKYADVIAYHLYVGVPEEEVPLIQKIRSTMAANGVGNKPVWNTETGWAVESKSGDVASRAKALGLTPISAPQAGAYAIRVLALAWDTGVSRYYWYTWDNQPEAMVEPDGTPKATAVAFAQGVKWLEGATMKSCDSDSSGTWTCHITRDQGYEGYVVWNTRGAKEFSVPSAWKARTQRDMYGHSLALKGSSARISIEPVLLENQAP